MTFHLQDVANIQAFWLSLKMSFGMHCHHVGIGCAAKHMLNNSIVFYILWLSFDYNDNHHFAGKEIITFPFYKKQTISQVKKTQ